MLESPAKRARHALETSRRLLCEIRAAARSQLGDGSSMSTDSGNGLTDGHVDSSDGNSIGHISTAARLSQLRASHREAHVAAADFRVEGSVHAVSGINGSGSDVGVGVGTESGNAYLRAEAAAASQLAARSLCGFLLRARNAASQGAEQIPDPSSAVKEASSELASARALAQSVTDLQHAVTEVRAQAAGKAADLDAAPRAVAALRLAIGARNIDVGEEQQQEQQLGLTATASATESGLPVASEVVPDPVRNIVETVRAAAATLHLDDIDSRGTASDSFASTALRQVRPGFHSSSAVALSSVLLSADPAVDLHTFERRLRSGALETHERHPVSALIAFVFPLDDGTSDIPNTGRLLLRFSYFAALGVIGVSAEVSQSRSGSVTSDSSKDRPRSKQSSRRRSRDQEERAASLLRFAETTPHALLAELFAGDDGLVPNGKGDSSLELSTTFTGPFRAYQWAQWLAGARNSSDQAAGALPLPLPLEIRREVFESFVDRLKQRLISFIKLQHQVILLCSEGKLPSEVSSVTFPNTPVSRVERLREISGDEATSSASRFDLGRSSLERVAHNQLFTVAEGNRFFSVKIVASKTSAGGDDFSLNALIVIDRCYPVVPPLMILDKWRALRRPSNKRDRVPADRVFNNAVCEVERRVNSTFDDVTPNHAPHPLVLSFMIARLLKLVDVLAAASSSGEKELRRGGERVSMYRGRDRSLLGNWVE